MVRYHCLLVYQQIKSGLKAEQVRELIEDHHSMVSSLAAEISRKATK